MTTEHTPQKQAILEAFWDVENFGDYTAMDTALQRYMATIQHDHQHDWEELAPVPVRREGSKSAYVTVPAYWCAECGAKRIDGKVTWPRRIVHPPPVLSEE